VFDPRGLHIAVVLLESEAVQPKHAGLAILGVSNLLGGIVAGPHVFVWGGYLRSGHLPPFPTAVVLALLVPAASTMLAAWVWRRDPMNAMSPYAFATGVAALVIATVPSLLALTLVGN